MHTRTGHIAIDTSVSCYVHFHIFMKAIAKHAPKMKRETLISGNRSLTSFGKLSGMQADSAALEGNFTNISRLGKLHFAQWIIVMRVKDLYCSMVYVCDCIYVENICSKFCYCKYFITTTKAVLRGGGVNVSSTEASLRICVYWRDA